jgi:chitin disaccharide deacetylase
LSTANKSLALIVCADDYAQSLAIDTAILQLIAAGRLSATSCMTLSPRWQLAAMALRSLRDKADIGLHLDFTQFSQSIRLSHPKLIMACLSGLISKTAIRQNIVQQLEAFELALGTPPDYIDGHLHVHQLPIIREILFELLIERYGKLSQRPWLRVSSPPAGTGFKAAVIHYLGANKLNKLAKQYGFKTSPMLLGVYDFTGDSLAYFEHWKIWLSQLQVFYAKQPVEKNNVPVVLMCHPASTIDDVDKDDPIATARVNEWRLLQSAEFAEWWVQAGLVLSKG